jgi:hypothetical protein
VYLNSVHQYRCVERPSILLQREFNPLRLEQALDASVLNGEAAKSPINNPNCSRQKRQAITSRFQSNLFWPASR